MQKVRWALGAFLTFSIANAQVLSEPALYNRCYSHLTGKPVPITSTIMPQVRQGKVKALAACASLLDKSQLSAGGPLVNYADGEARSVLNNLYAFHRTWFSGNTMEQIQDYSAEISLGTMDVYDTTEPALALTRAALAQGARYADVLTLGVGVAAIREEDQKIRTQIGWTITAPGRAIYGNNGSFDLNVVNFRHYTAGFSGDSSAGASYFVQMPKIAVGELTGIRARVGDVFNVPNVSLAPLANDRRGNEQPGLNFSYNFYSTMGGGVLGSPIYMLLNFGHGFGVNSNGALKLPRRWAQSNMSAFLCAELPALRESDIQAFVIGNSTTPFRNSSSCVLCHASLDQMAYTARNAVVANSDYFQISAGPYNHAKPVMMLATYRAEIGSVNGWPSETVLDFHRQVPSGRLYFRSMTGELINRSVTGVAQLGAAMTETSDFYQCAAKRYFEFLTGIKVALYDRQDPKNSSLNESLSADATADRVFIEKLGQDLRATQSIPKLIKSIMASDYYSHVNYRP